MKTNSKIAVGYIRVSTEEQAAEGVSLAMQREKLRQWAALNGYELAAVYSDGGKSGKKTTNRPNLQAALDHACRSGAVVVVYSLSRLARSVRDTLNIAERLDKAGADLASISEQLDTTTAAGKMVFRMLAVLAEFEREQVGERTAAALRHLKAQGKRYSRRIPIGYRLGDDGKSLEPDEGERATLKRIRSLSAEGGSLRSIVATLATEGIRRRDGSPISVKTVRIALAAKAA